VLYLYPVGKRVIDLLKVINEHLASCYRLTAEELQAEISPIQRECTTLPLEVFSQRNCSRLHSIEVEFHSKQRSSLFEPPFGRLRGNVRASSIARWKARLRLPIRHN